ncbi:MAG TPA: alpha/beta hydrolase [Pseudomonadales bacterium]|nr:alpha/beta hydrolase [Pseudomonadales bacterium]
MKKTAGYKLLPHLLLALLFGVTASANVYAWDALEDSLFNVLASAGRAAADLETKSIEVTPGCQMVYYESSGTGETAVLLHGFTGDKDNWTRFAAAMKPYHLIIPDLGGHGQTCFDEKTIYSIPFQAQLLHTFLSKLNVKSFHLAGNSMGGWISTYYAAEYPDDVKSIGLFDAGGVNSPVKSEFFLAQEKGENQFFFTDRAGFDAFLKLAMQDPPFMPWPVMNVQFRHILAQQPRMKKIFNDISGKTEGAPQNQMVDGLLEKIKQPTLILWGKQDQILNVSMADEFAKGLSNHEKVILDGVGHVPMLERAEETAKIYSAFIDKHK